MKNRAVNMKSPQSGAVRRMGRGLGCLCVCVCVSERGDGR